MGQDLPTLTHDQEMRCHDRVRLGGAPLLDAREPGWHRRIDVSTLDLGDFARCVLGQLFPLPPGAVPSPSDNGYVRGCLALGLDYGPWGRAAELGFCFILTHGRATYYRLGRAARVAQVARDGLAQLPILRAAWAEAIAFRNLQDLPRPAPREVATS